MYVQLLDEQTQKDFLSILFNSGSDFCHLRFESFSQNVKIFVLKNFVFGHFMTPFVSGSKLREVLGNLVS